MKALHVYLARLMVVASVGMELMCKFVRFVLMRLSTLILKESVKPVILLIVIHARLALLKSVINA